MPKHPKYPKRFVVIPPSAGGLTLAVSRAGRRATARAALAARSVPPPAPGMKVVKTSPADGAVLVRADGLSLADVRDKVEPGIKVFEEQWYRLDRPARPWMKRGAQLKKPRVLAGRAFGWTVTVTVDDGKGGKAAPLKDALVTAMVNAEKAIGIEARTDRRGRARFELSRTTARVDAVYVEPLHGGWPVAVPDVAVDKAGFVLKVPPIALDAPDVRGVVYGQPAAGAGAKVRVAVIDTGVGRHAALRVRGGLNATGESRKFTDEDGHGTHVAGVIASTAAGWRRGEADAVELHAYRIFKAGSEFASTFDISTAIKQAAADGCDLINLSIGGAEDGAVKDAIALAWEAGCVCVAATGNDGSDEIDHPAAFGRAIAVSAIGLEASWPAGTYLEWTLGAAKGRAIGGLRTFFASFANRGPKVALTAPGVAVVSTIFDNRWGVMSGTSMATPIATGVLARRLARSPVLAMPRDAARAAAIVKLAADHAEDIGMPANRQGRGLAR